MLVGTPAWAAEQAKVKPAKPSVTTKETQQVIENAVLDPNARQALETVKTILPELKDWTQIKAKLYKSPMKSYYNVEITKSPEFTYPRAGVTIAENTGEVRAFFLQKDRPTFPESFANDDSSSPEKEQAMKEATAASDALLKKLLGEKATNYAFDSVNFITYGNSSTIVASISYRAKIQKENAPLDLININMDASGQPAMFINKTRLYIMQRRVFA